MITLKTPDQIKYIHDSCQLLAELHDEIEDFIEVGMSTKDIDVFTYDFITKRGGKPAFLNYMGFPASACVSVNDEVIHGIPSSKKIINKGDVVSVDIGINLNGYFSDAARTHIAGGSASAEVEQLVSITQQCLYEGIAGAGKEKARIHDISRPIYELAKAHKYGVVKDYCGHGVGLAIHEDPQIPNYVGLRSANPRLREGMVLAIEPMINLGTERVLLLEDGWTVITEDRKPSAHWEHTIAVTKDGILILTQLD
ncbi:MAG: type I methionyl aminopeptidase [Sphaerochaetaceae bacterium]|jgi:methionyl aminopeptidase